MHTGVNHTGTKVVRYRSHQAYGMLIELNPVVSLVLGLYSYSIDTSGCQFELHRVRTYESAALCTSFILPAPVSPFPNVSAKTSAPRSSSVHLTLSWLFATLIPLVVCHGIISFRASTQYVVPPHLRDLWLEPSKPPGDVFGGL